MSLEHKYTMKTYDRVFFDKDYDFSKDQIGYLLVRNYSTLKTSLLSKTSNLFKYHKCQQKKASTLHDCHSKLE